MNNLHQIGFKKSCPLKFESALDNMNGTQMWRLMDHIWRTGSRATATSARMKIFFFFFFQQNNNNNSSNDNDGDEDHPRHKLFIPPSSASVRPVSTCLVWREKWNVPFPQIMKKKKYKSKTTWAVKTLFKKYILCEIFTERIGNDDFVDYHSVCWWCEGFIGN